MPSIRIGLLDTGVDSRHEDLAGKITANYITEIGCKPIQVDHGQDHNDHGTACAGIISRIAPDAEIHSVQIIGDKAQDHPQKLIAGLAFAIAQGWEIINISAGCRNPNDELHQLVQRAHAAGTILIAAKDNQPGIIGYPAAYPEVIAVDMEHFTDPLDWRYFPGAEIEVEAAGIYIDAPVPGGGRKFYTGTSFAAPHLAGIAATWKESHPDEGMLGFREFLAEHSS